MAKFNKKKLAEACDGLKNAVVSQLCNENLPKKPEDWARLYETQAEKIFEECERLLPYAFAQTLKTETEALKKMFPNTNQNTEIMKLKKNTENQNKENEGQKLKEDTEMMRMHYGMLLDHHIIDFDMFENKVGKENVPEILQEYNKILMKGELAEYEPDFTGICRHGNVDCALKELCLVGFKCNHEHEHSNAKMCYMNKTGGELETFLLKNNTSVPKLLEMERTIAEKKQETGKVPPITSYGECTHPNKECKYRKDGKCPDAPMAIQFCRNCSDEDLQKADEFAKALPHALKQIAEEKERVNHPRHYQHPSGIECITVARHHDFNTGNALKYLWRAGLKEEQGLTPLEKQIEDLQKAVWFLQDEIQFLKEKQQEQ